MVFYCVKHLLEHKITPESIVEAVPWRRNRFFETFAGVLDADQVIEAFSTKWSDAKNPKFKRYFWKDEELFHIDNKTYVLSNQWGTRTLEVIEAFAITFPEAKINYKEAV